MQVFDRVLIFDLTVKTKNTVLSQVLTKRKSIFKALFCESGYKSPCPHISNRKFSRYKRFVYIIPYCSVTINNLGTRNNTAAFLFDEN